MPFAFNRHAPKIGCKSVATPGNGRVEISIEEISFTLFISIEFSLITKSAPISLNFFNSMGRQSGLIPSITPDPCVAKNAAR